MAILKDLIKQAKEAAAALNVTKRKVWEEIYKEFFNAKGKTPNSKKKTVLESLSINEQKTCSNPDKFVRDLVDHV